MSCIPKNIFQVWFQGEKNLSNKNFQQNVINWKVLNPEWNYHFVTDAELRTSCKSYSDKCLQTYDNFSVLHQKIDFGRYVLLYLHGGLYVDMDMYAFRSLDKNENISHIVNNPT